MVLSGFRRFFKEEDSFNHSESLSPSFKTLLKMKNEVLYLKDFSLKKTSHISGDAQSAFKGRGVEFEEIRPYQFGDDVRDIDWRVTARKNQPYTKLYMEEKDREIYIFLDLSEKMYFGTTHELKSVTACKITSLLGFYALSYKDRVGFAIYTGKQTHVFEARRQTDYFLSVLKKVESLSQELLNQTNDMAQSFSQALQVFEKKIGKNAIAFIVSSFDTEDKGLLNSLSAFMIPREVYLIDIFDRLELISPPTGEYAIFYHDQNDILQTGSLHYDELYKSYFENKRKVLKDLCLKYGQHYRAVQTDLPIALQLKPI